MTKQEYVDYIRCFEAGIDGLEYLSSGYCPGCRECEEQYGLCEEGENYPEVEPSFSWRPCEICNSHLGGDRYPVHGCIDSAEDGVITVHLEACVDCVYYLEYGRLDDMTMLEIEEN